MTMTQTENEMTHPIGSAPLAVAAPRGPAMPALITDEHREILRAMVDRNATPAQVEMLIVVGNRYDLDPLMGHVVLINGKCFVTHKGLMHKAHASGAFDGIETLYGRDDQGDFCECHVYRKDMTRPFQGRIYLDEYRAAGPVWKQHPRAMGAKTAESFVLRRAFDVSLTSQEEMGVDRVPEDGAPMARQEMARPEHNERAMERPAGTPACAKCGKALTKAQQDLSVRNYGEALCPTHQQSRRSSPRPAPQGPPAQTNPSRDHSSQTASTASSSTDSDDPFEGEEFEGRVQDANGGRDLFAARASSRDPFEEGLHEGRAAR